MTVGELLLIVIGVLLEIYFLRGLIKSIRDPNFSNILFLALFVINAIVIGYCIGLLLGLIVMSDLINTKVF